MNVEESLSDVDASSTRLTMNLQPFIQEDLTLVEFTGMLGEDCVLTGVLDGAVHSQAHGLEYVSGHLVPSASLEHRSC